ncbi:MULTISPECIES: YuzD family protein [unclassified Thermoactinomyces]|uniref:YuzD family protein n=1 Tax=unclassified Thermoactinomyces TaxID=2634588 RepID=UPI0018DBB987|nr:MULTISPECIES: DUF1462 family protein [unclassified Thermoactinomyces]MBH8598923.1 YuzD family protein [Thermoactinomyces sp. CICC 10523]MBH8604909.1 YuzD family protein [Thermoactinomyces sp. CICC 10522]
MKPIEVLVYGAKELCASCVNLPSSRETATWLRAALGRKYGEQVSVRYIDIFNPQTEEEAAFSRKVIDEDLWYPVVVIAEQIVAEGNPKLKEIVRIIEERGAVQIGS